MNRFFVPVLLSAAVLCAPPSTRAESHASPSRVLIVGDSMMVLTANALGARLDRRDGIAHRTHASLGSGLARLDIFDWMEKLDELKDAFQPDLTIAWFGANDNQPMTVDGRVVQPDTDAWSEEYARRIGLAMDKLTAAPGARVLWLELPDMQDAREQEHGNRVNELVRTEAENRPAVDFMETRPFLSRRPGTYHAHIIGPNGMPLRIRSSDGGHLNHHGANRMADTLVDHFWGGRGP